MFGASKSGKASVGGGGGGTVTDAQIKYVTTLLTGDGTNGATNGGSSATTVPSVISDASTNNFNLAIAGDVKPNRFNPDQDGYYGNSFDGATATRLSTTGTSALAFGTAAYTMEAWVYITTAAANISTVFDAGNATNSISLGVAASGALAIGKYGIGNVLISTAGDVPLNQWVHVAAVRTSTATNGTVLYVNGVVKATGTDANNWTVVTTATVGGINLSGYTTTGYISNLRVVNGTAVYTSAFTPPTVALTPVTNTVLLTCQSPRFIDNSANNFTLTTAGSPSITYQQPFAQPSTVNVPNYYSGKLEGSGNNVSIADNTSLRINSGDTNTFVAEAWVYFKAVTANSVIFDKSGRNSVSFANWAVYLSASSQFALQWGASGSPGTSGIGVLPTSIIPTTNTWYHVAFVKSSSDWALFINGTRQAAYSGLNTAADANPGPLRIGVGISSESTGVFFNGIISNVRVYNGVAGGAPYSATSTTLTVPTAPLTAITGTALLTLQDSMFKDNSTNALAVTGVGTAQPVAVTPFTQTYTSSTVSNLGSAYFDGTGDYLTAPANAGLTLGTSDYTVECWVNLQGTQTTTYGWGVIGTYPGSGTGWSLTINRSTTTAGIVWIIGGAIVGSYTTAYIPVGVWTHLAVTRSGTGTNNTKIFLNGVVAAQVTDNTNDTFSGLTYLGGQGTGQLFTGYISNARVVKGTAVYTSNFAPPLAPLAPIPGSQLLSLQYNGATNDSGFIDSSPNDFTITRYGNTTQGSAAPFGNNWSNYFPSVGDYVSFTDTASFGTGDFTVECFVFPTASAHNIIMSSTTAANWDLLTYGNQIYWHENGGNLGGAGYGTVPQNQWVHLAASRTGGNLNLYINGTRVYSAANTFNYSASASRLVGPNGGSAAYYASNVRLIKGTGIYSGTTITVPTAPLTPITGTSLLTCQSPTFIDNGPNAFALTTAGTPSVQRFSPFSYITQTPQSYSTYFNGSSSTLIPAGAFFSGAGTAATLEVWVYPTALSYTLLRCNGNATSISLSTNSSGQYIVSDVFAADFLTSTIAITLNTWHHVAVTRTSGNVYTIYINGVSGGSATYAASLGSQPSYIAYNTYNAGYHTFYVSNLRNVNGTVVYTGAFTPPTSPLTAISGTSLLTCQNTTIKDNSTNAFTITATGSPTPKQLNPFGYTTSAAQSYSPTIFGGSMYFDGTGDYLQTPTTNTFNFGTSNFTIEAWIYSTSLGSNRRFISLYSGGGTIQITFRQDVTNAVRFFTTTSGIDITSSTLLTANTWNHCAIVRNGSVFTLYLNGVSVGTVTSSSALPTTSNLPLYISTYDGTNEPWAGYISNLRIVQGTALYTSNFVPPLAPLTPVTNTQLLMLGTNAGIYDNSMQTVFETVGNAQISTTQKKYGTGSMYFDGTGDYLTAPYSKLQDLTSGDFTVEAWVYRNVIGAEHNIAVTRSSAGTDGWNLRINSSNTLQFYFTGGTSVTSTGTIPATTWTHVAATRSGTTLRLFINGVIDGSTTVSDGTANTQPFRVGVANDNATGYMNGYIDDLRITKGYARYTANFTPPTAALPTS